jgi:hypothetical protein
LEGRKRMRLHRRDLIATGLVAAAGVLYVLWATGFAPPGLRGIRASGLGILALGFAASASAVVPNFNQLLHGNKMYLVVTSLIGLGALVGGLLVLFAASDAALGVVMAAMAVLWVMATVRHSLVPGTPASPSGSALDAARPEPASARTR